MKLDCSAVFSDPFDSYQKIEFKTVAYPLISLKILDVGIFTTDNSTHGNVSPFL